MLRTGSVKARTGRPWAVLRGFLSLAVALVVTGKVLAQDWQMYGTPERAGWSSSRLQELFDDSGAAAMMTVHEGKVVAALGDVTRRFKCHSMRKSLLSALYGIYVGEGKIDVERTLEELLVDDVTPLTGTERKARIIDLLKARSGVYLPAGAETPEMKARRPGRGSHPPDTFWYYNNWDFNALGTIFERLTGRDIFAAFQERIATPVGMQEFRVTDGTHDYSERGISIHPSYPFKMSARDLARFGQLYLQRGGWSGGQVIPRHWIEASTRSHSAVAGEGPGCDGYGYLWWIDEDAEQGRMFFASGHGGQYVGVFPAEQVVIVLLADTYAGRFIRDRHLLVKGILGARTSPPSPDPGLMTLPAVPPVEAAYLADDEGRRYLGTYQGQYSEISDGPSGEESAAEFHIIEQNGELFLERYDYFYHHRLLPRGNGRFFVEDLGIVLAFQFDEGSPTAPAFHATEKLADLYDTLMAGGLDGAGALLAAAMEDAQDEFHLKLLANALEKARRIEESLEIRRLAVARFPSSVAVHRDFINNYVAGHSLAETATVYERMLSTASDDPQATDLIRWFAGWLRVRAAPAPLGLDEAARYTGTYQGRVIDLRDGALHYRRSGERAASEYRLARLQGHDFVIDHPYLDGVRFSFTMDEAGRAASLVAIHIDGHRQEWARSEKP